MGERARDDVISRYSIDPATGKLAPKSPATATIGPERGAIWITIAPDGKSAYVADYYADAISQYAISPATGALSRRPASTAGTVRAPELIVLAPDGKNAYITGDIGGLSQYAISPATGKITPLSPATVTTPPGGSIGLAVTPAPDPAAK